MRAEAFLLSLCLPLAACHLEFIEVGGYVEYCPDYLEDEFLYYVNEARNSGRYCGDRYYPAVPALSWSIALENTAGDHAEDMAEYDFVSDLGSDGTSLDIRLQSNGYIAISAGENIGAGYASSYDTVRAWLDDPAYCANLMAPDYQHMGSACAGRKGTQYGTYWTLVLSLP